MVGCLHIPYVCFKFTTESVREKKENRLIFGEVMGESLVSCLYLTQGVELVLQTFFQLLDRLQNYRIFNVRTII